MPPVDVTLFGSPSIRVRGRAASTSTPRKAFELLAALCLRPRAEADRSLLEGWLWPESPKDKAQACLRQALRRLRQMLGPEAGRLRARGRALSFDLQGVAVDALVFDRAVARGTPEGFKAAVDTHRGPLLEGWDSEWIAEQRTPRFAAWVGALGRVAQMCVANGAHQDALPLLERVVHLEPLEETAVVVLMEVYAAVGRHTDAIRVYRAYRARLNTELRTEPNPTTSLLHARLCREARAAARNHVRARRPHVRTNEPAGQMVVLDGTATTGNLEMSVRIEVIVPAGVPASGWQVRLTSPDRREERQPVALLGTSAGVPATGLRMA